MDNLPGDLLRMVLRLLHRSSLEKACLLSAAEADVAGSLVKSPRVLDLPDIIRCMLCFD
jgi:hypothetical protein